MVFCYILIGPITLLVPSSSIKSRSTGFRDHRGSVNTLGMLENRKGFQFLSCKFENQKRLFFIKFDDMLI